jgi:signal transduction histidine kinase
MTDLAAWLEQHFDILVQSATTRLSQDRLLQAQAIEAIDGFYDGLLRCARTDTPTPLYAILIDWMETRSARIDEGVETFTPILVKLKQTTIEQIIARCPPADAVQLLIAADHIFTDALTYLSHLESEALLHDMQNRLRKAQTQIERLNKNKSDFIAIAAHELKTPLTVVEGYIGMVRSIADSDDNPYLGSIVGGIDGGLRRLREIIDDLIDVSMIDLKLLNLRLQPAWLRHILLAAERSIIPSVEQRGQQFMIHWDTFPDEPMFVDPERLLQVLYKVIMNAVKYTPDGGMIVVGARELPGFIDIMVIDNGIGIAPANLTRIFDAFTSIGDVSLHSSGKVKFKGNGPGLGLPIAKGIMEAHGGSIWAESPGYNEQTCPGSTFHLLVPLYDALPEANILDNPSTTT